MDGFINRRPAHRVTLIPGDGIGPEVVGAAVRVVEATGVAIDWEECAAGAAVFAAGDATGVPRATLESIERTGVVLKGPLETPVGHGGKSANVTLRKMFETYGNIRPARELPGVRTPYSGRGVDLVIVRENVEDLYAGIEHMQTPGVAQCLKLITRHGCEKIARLAFELALAEGRTVVHCATKANIMKLTEGLMKKVFEEVAADYPGVEARHVIVDNCAHRLVTNPEDFQVIVTTNLNGDILSDLAAGLVGGLGLAPSANIGARVAMFEAVHGSAPDIAGRDIANPTASILAAAMMLRHLGETAAAEAVEEAVAAVLATGAARTVDIADGREPVGTDAFTEAVIGSMGAGTPAVAVRTARPLRLPPPANGTVVAPVEERSVIGVDVFVESGLDAADLGRNLDAIAAGTAFHLKMISNRGTKVWPVVGTPPDTVDHWRCRFVLRAQVGSVGDRQLFDLLQRIGREHRWMHVEKLQRFDGAAAYSLAQGEA